MKNRIAQSNRAAGSKNPPPQMEANDNNDSDVDPTDKPDNSDAHGGGSSAVNAAQVQLNP